MKKGTRRLIFEFMSIVVAVVLAMGLTEWRQSILNHRQAAESFQNIIEEIEENLEELLQDSAKVAKNLKDIADWLKAETDRKDTIDFTINFELSFMSSSAWDVAKLNQSLTFLDNDKVLRVSGVYETQDFYEKSAGEVFDSMVDLVRIEDTNSDAYRKELRALRFKIGLAYSGLVTYTQVSRNFLKEHAIPSEQEDQ